MKIRTINSKSILSKKNVLSFYRGCTHGCLCCANRSRCAGVKDFTEIGVKTNAPELFDLALRSKRKKCMISVSTLSDPYQPVEKELGLFRSLLEIMYNRQFGVNIRTRSDLILRDLELLEEMNYQTKVTVQISLSTLNNELCQKLEPGACGADKRIQVIRELKRAGIGIILRIKPIIPLITDSLENLDNLLDFALSEKLEGILLHGFGMKVNNTSREYFFQELTKRFPELAQEFKSEFGIKFLYESKQTNALEKLFLNKTENRGILTVPREIFFYEKKYRNRSQGEQLRFF